LLEPFLALDGAGNVYASAPAGSTVIKFNSAGQQVAQKNSGGAITLKTPTGLTVGSDGIVYVVDTAANGVVNLGEIK